MASSPFRTLHWLCSCLATCLGLSLAPQVASAQPLPTVPHVDLARYAGTWHEIARQPCLPAEVFAQLKQQACQLGFDVDRLVKDCR